MISLIRRIEERGFTYMAGGNLYFDITRMPSYGELALLKTEELRAGARIEVDENKRNPHDFVLWFTKSKFENQALIWDSPWGRGYPGWHIECSAMSMKYLGEQFDIHAGGIDHIPVHHTNEIAQSEAATGKKWVNYWLHNEFLVIDKGKMSKSAGGFLTLQTLVDKGYDPEDYRYFLLGGHYRSQLQFSWEGLDSARSSRKALNERVLGLRARLGKGEDASTRLEALPDDLKGALSPRLVAFAKALGEDLATPRALAEIWALLKDNELSPRAILAGAFDMDRVLGLGLAELRDLSVDVDAGFAAEIGALVELRAKAKREKNFSRADEIRNELKSRGIILEDGTAGTLWKKA
jgi:cysteinyl-tRNA synthetase